MHTLLQDYVETAEQVYCPSLLPEGPADALLMEMLVPAPYKVPEKKAEKKAPGIRKGLRRKVVQKPRPKTMRQTPPTKGRRRKKKTPHTKRMRGPGRRTRGPEKAPGARPSYPCHLMTTRQILPAEAGGTKKKLYLPELGRREREDLPWRGRLGRPRRGRCPFRTTPPQPLIVRSGGCPGGKPPV